MDRFPEAAEAFEKVIAQRGPDTSVMLQLSNAQINAGQPERARQTLERTLELDRQCEAAYCQHILACALMGDHDEAEVSFYLARQITEACPACLDHLGRSFAMRRDHNRSIACWQAARQLDPGYPGLGANLARAYQRSGQPHRALALYMHELRQDPGNRQLLIDLASLLCEQGRPVEASEKLRRALELDALDIEAMVALGDVYLTLGQPELARKRFSQAAGLERGWPGVQLGLASACLAMGDTPGAIRHAVAEMATDGQSPKQALQLANLLLQLREHGRAADWLGPMVEGNDPLLIDEPDAYVKGLHLLGLARLSLGEAKAAAVTFRRVLRVGGHNDLALRSLAEAYLQSGRLARASAICRAALRDKPLDRSLCKLSRRIRLTALRSRTGF